MRRVLQLESEVRHRCDGALADDEAPAAIGDQPATVGKRRDRIAEQLAVEARERLRLRTVAPQVV